MQETGSLPHASQESATPAVAFEEADLALIDALQTDPRAPWSRVGPAVGIDATTAARRWARLEREGLAWVTAYAGPATTTVAYVEVTCRPRRVEELAARLVALPWVFSAELVVGDYDLFLSVAAPDLPALGRRVTEDIGRLPGVRGTRTRLSMRLYQEGSNWKVRALEPAGRARLTAHGAAGAMTGSTTPCAFLPRDDVDLKLLLALGANGRAGYAELAERVGISESTVRRRLARELRDREILLRCDLAQQLAGWPALATYRARVPHGELDSTGAALARLPQMRLCTSVTGSCNLLFSVWLRDLDGMAGLESLLDDRFPRLRIEDRTVTLRTAKRMGRLLDDHGRARGYVPVGL
ncbi:Lrp/AsnC family transcriptional regulator [Streptomyces xanthii]|uniref:Lrp/AsnC family transcriptional regulator n=1 Tax=Streptomyces xanthii TaxID=2768069 RepID=A0A7H1B6L8_9ACTN|nr:Lrp/AsnC family transcriptional regulator [Streptomyces xanthii]QNS04373.1 Lrp/AsnC family transcriptional regulator [Streptomyces xanthii]